MLSLLLFAAGLATAALPATSPAPNPTAEPEIIKPPESLIVDGVPAIPADLGAALRSYTEYRGAGFLSFHPERREMLIGTRFADTVQIHRVVAAGGARTQLTFFPDRVSSAAYPRAPLGEHPFFVFAKDTGGSEFWQLYRFDLETSAVTLLTDGRSRNTMGAFSRHGHRLAYTSTRRNGADNDLYIVDPTDPKSDRRWPRSRAAAGRSSTGRRTTIALLVSEEISINESYFWSFDVATGERTALTPRAKPKNGREGRVPLGALGRRRAVAVRGHRSRQRVLPAGAPRSGHRKAHLPQRPHPLGRRGGRSRPTTGATWRSSPTRTASGACTCSTRARARRGARPRCRPAR